MRLPLLARPPASAPLQRPGVPTPPHRAELRHLGWKAKVRQRWSAVLGIVLVVLTAVVAINTDSMWWAFSTVMGTIAVIVVMASLDRRPRFHRHEALSMSGRALVMHLCASLPNGHRYQMAVAQAQRDFVNEDLTRLRRYQQDLARWEAHDRAFVAMSETDHAQHLSAHPEDAAWWTSYRDVPADGTSSA